MDSSPSFDSEDRLDYINSISVYLLGEKGAIGTPAAIVNLIKIASSTKAFISSAKLDGFKQTLAQISLKELKNLYWALVGSW